MREGEEVSESCRDCGCSDGHARVYIRTPDGRSGRWSLCPTERERVAQTLRTCIACEACGAVVNCDCGEGPWTR